MQSLGSRTSASGRCLASQAPAGHRRLTRPLRQAIVCSSAASPRFFVGGNWKCNGTIASVTQLCDDLNAGSFPEDIEVVCAPSFIHLGLVRDKLSSAGKYKVAAQNCWEFGNGAYTGEISAEELVDFGIPWVILGHSERRSLIHETNELIANKVKHAQDVGLSVIICVGETLDERNSGKMYNVLESQCSVLVGKVKDWSKVVIAYEPVWAIGTGVVASPEQAQEVHGWLRRWFAANVGTSVSQTLRIIYGGSANDSNCNSLASQTDIDGFLVGGASLKGPAFVKIVQAGVLKSKQTSPAA